MKHRSLSLFSIALLAASSVAFGQDDTELLKDVQGPFNRTANLALQNDFYFNYGPNAGTLYVLNVEPTLPMNMIGGSGMHRLTLPVISQPSLTAGGDGTFGLGDLTYRYLLFAGDQGSRLGGGVTLSLPTSTDTSLGSGKWSIGPSVGGSWRGDPWLLGALLTQIWSFAGDSDRSYVSQAELRLYGNYNIGSSFYLAAYPTVLVDWTEETDKWRIPIGGGIGTFTNVGSLKSNIQLQAFYNIENMRNDANWSLRFLFQVLFP